jgi:hypothetical protein
MKEFIVKFSLILVTSSLVCFASCKKDPKSEDKPKEPVTTEKAFEALKEFAEAGNQFSATVKESGSIVDETGLAPTKNLHETSGYPMISCVAQGDGTWLVICDYGPELIPCDDGYQRRGIVNILTTGLFTTIGTVMTVTFDDFYQKGDWLPLEYKIDGTQVITHSKLDVPTVPEMRYYTVTVADGLITYNNKEIHYSETTTRALWYNDELCSNNWYIVGEWNGISSSDVPYTLKADDTAVLRYKVCCHFFQDGILNIDVEGLSPFYIDYGYFEEESDCDRKAMLYYPGISPIVINM